MAGLIFTPRQLRAIELRNRIIISPMCQYSADRTGYASDWHLAHYGRLAMGGPGLVFVEATAVSPEGRLGYGDLGLWSDDHIPGLSRIASFIEAEGVVAGIQLGHCGRKAGTQRPWHGHAPLGEEDIALRGEEPWETVSVSAEPVDPTYPIPTALSLKAIKAHVELWRTATVRARKAGFRALEIHGAHGYIINAFLSPLLNQREDAYGGDFEGRTRLALEIAEAVRSAWPEEYPLFFRISAVDASRDGWGLADSVSLARILKEKGVDVIDCSSGGIGGDLSVIPRGPGFQVPFAEEIRAQAAMPTVAVGLITEPVQANDILEQGRADFVAIGREALFNPNWPLHARLALDPDAKFDPWPPQSGWWLNRRRPRLPSARSRPTSTPQLRAKPSPTLAYPRPQQETQMQYLETRVTQDGIAHVVLNRAPANAVNRAMYCEIADLFNNIDQIGDNVRVVILSGKGPHFCAGNDLDEFATMNPENAVERMWRVREAFFAISECAVPVIGAVHGAAVGTGLCLAASCDFMVASKDAKFALPELTVGVMGGARHLARIAPEPLVRRMFLAGEPLLAPDFAAAGAALIVCDRENLMSEAERLASRVASFSPTAVRVGKRVLDRIEWMDLREGYEFEQAATERMSGHPDSGEALAAFRERRAANYEPLSLLAQWHGM